MGNHAYILPGSLAHSSRHLLLEGFKTILWLGMLIIQHEFWIIQQTLDIRVLSPTNTSTVDLNPTLNCGMAWNRIKLHLSRN